MEASTVHPERKRLRIDGFDYSQRGYVYFATLCARGRGFRLDSPPLATHIVECIHWLRENGRWKVYCFCLMSDHLHLAVSVGESGRSLCDTISSFKKWTTKKAWELGLQGKLWQHSWYDHVARMEEDLLAICEYILQNPVRRGLVEEQGQWAYSGMPDPLPL
jgi:REP element-mobilizing transposase RayT